MKKSVKKQGEVNVTERLETWQQNIGINQATVTDLARDRGLSTLRFKEVAVKYANNCPMTS